MSISVQKIRQLAAHAPHAAVYQSPHFPPSVYYRFMRLLAGEMHPAMSVVLGVCGGGDCLHLAQGWSEGVVYGIDNADDHKGNINYITSNFPNFHFLLDDSIAVLEHDDVFAKTGVDILFIDTIHTYERTMAEFNAWKPFMTPGAVVMLDDLFRNGMQRAWEELPGAKMRLDDLHIGGSPTDGGFGVILL